MKMINIRAYYDLAKPGIVYGNVLVAAAGFLYASRGMVNWPLFCFTILGLSLVIASACVCNNYYDCDIDKKMLRTAARPIASGQIKSRPALTFGSLLGIAGTLLLYFFTTPLSFAVALVGWIIYVCIYTPLKHVSPQALWVGAIAGATPPVVGYVAVTNALDLNALALFIFICLWQIPHFLGIAAYRYEEYAAAGIPLLLKKPGARGKRIGRIVFYASLLILLAWCLALMLHR